MQRCHVEQDEAGFTLVEVLVAFVVSALLLTMIFSAVQVASERRKRATMQAQAVGLARTRMEVFLARPFAQKSDQGRAGTLIWHEQEDAAMRDPRGLMVLARLRLSIVDSHDRRLLTIERRKLKSALDQ